MHLDDLSAGLYARPIGGNRSGGAKRSSDGLLQAYQDNAGVRRFFQEAE